MPIANNYYDEEWGQFISLDTTDLKPEQFYKGTHLSIMTDSTYPIDIESCGAYNLDNKCDHNTYIVEGSIATVILDSVLHSVASLIYFITTLKK